MTLHLWNNGVTASLVLAAHWSLNSADDKPTYNVLVCVKTMAAFGDAVVVEAEYHNQSDTNLSVNKYTEPLWIRDVVFTDNNGQTWTITKRQVRAEFTGISEKNAIELPANGKALLRLRFQIDGMRLSPNGRVEQLPALENRPRTLDVRGCVQSYAFADGKDFRRVNVRLQICGNSNVSWSDSRAPTELQSTKLR